MSDCFSFSDGSGFHENVMFGADMSLFVHIDNKEKDHNSW